MDKARALLAAGLAEDAARELDGAITSFRRQRLDQDLAEAELARSQAALAAGDLAAARRWAAAAERRFRRRGNDACACLAELTRLRARASVGTPPGAIAAEALLLAGRLRDCGLTRRRGRGGTASRPGRCWRPGAPTRRGSGSRACAAAGRRCRWTSACCAGWPAPNWREAKGGRAGAGRAPGRAWPWCTPAAAGWAAWTCRPAPRPWAPISPRAGLRLALDRGSARLVFAWLERSRAQAFRVRPVRPPADPRAAAVLAELRQLSYLIRQAELNGQRDPAASPGAANCSARSGNAAGRRAASASPSRQASLGRGAAALGRERAEPGRHPVP